MTMDRASSSWQSRADVELTGSDNAFASNHPADIHNVLMEMQNQRLVSSTRGDVLRDGKLDFGSTDDFNRLYGRLTDDQQDMHTARHLGLLSQSEAASGRASFQAYSRDLSQTSYQVYSRTTDAGTPNSGKTTYDVYNRSNESDGHHHGHRTASGTEIESFGVYDKNVRHNEQGDQTDAGGDRGDSAGPWSGLMQAMTGVIDVIKDLDIDDKVKAELLAKVMGIIDWITQRGGTNGGNRAGGGSCRGDGEDPTDNPGGQQQGGPTNNPGGPSGDQGGCCPCPCDDSGGNTGGEPGDNTGGEPGDNTGGEPGDNTGGEPGDNTGGDPGDNTGGDGTDIPKATPEELREAAKLVKNRGVSAQYEQEVMDALGKIPRVMIQGMIRNQVPIYLERNGGGTGGTYEWDPRTGRPVAITLFESAKSFGMGALDVLAAEGAHLADLGPGGLALSKQGWFQGLYRDIVRSGVQVQGNFLQDPVELVMAYGMWASGIKGDPSVDAILRATPPELLERIKKAFQGKKPY